MWSPPEVKCQSLVDAALLGACWLWRPLDHTVEGATCSSMPETNLISKELGEGRKERGQLSIPLSAPLCGGAEQARSVQPSLSTSW